MRFIYAFVLLAIMVISPYLKAEVQVRAVFDEADAVLNIMERMNSGAEVDEQLWASLWESAGYVRLLQRETSMGREEGFADKMRAWVQDPQNFSRVEEWRRAVDGFRSFNPHTPGIHAAAYLPEGVKLQASFYPVIKHTRNTFVFDLEQDPAIFMSVNLDDSALFVESVLSHELHHIGIAQCPAPEDFPLMNDRQQWVVEMLGIFGEGVATLAAAGGPLRHPHFYSSPTDWIIWERDIANISRDQNLIEEFFSAVLNGEFPEGDRTAKLFSFIVSENIPQGPAYTLGWKMAAIVERQFGRERLVSAICDPRSLLGLYNEAVEMVNLKDSRGLPQWSPEFLGKLYSER